jgi:glycosyltransferase involved in cell wall biosynthesis
MTNTIGMTGNDLICVSHLRWDFVYQRPQHLMSRAAKSQRVFFVEEPRVEDAIGENKSTARLEIRRDESGVLVVMPFLPSGLLESEVYERLTQLLEQMFDYHNITNYTLWFYTPMPLPAFLELSSRGHQPQCVVYDCMDELANFRFAPPELRKREAQLFAWADVVFTGGHSLYEAKSKQHDNVHPFPSSVDVDHFAKATLRPCQPKDLEDLPHPRVGFVGVIDERMDIELLGQIARARPQWHFVMIGPIVKISEEELPQGNNLHYLGQKAYKELPNYLAHIDVAMMPFAINESTQFISPTKTPEYLAAGKSVISTPIRDVVRPYGEKDLVVIADDCVSFVAGLEQLLFEDQTQRRSRADAFVNRLSWDQTWQEMERQLAKATVSKQQPVQTDRYSPQRYTRLPKALPNPATARQQVSATVTASAAKLVR